VRVGLDFHDLFVMPPQSVLPTTHIMLLVVVSMMWFSVFSSGNLVFQHHMCSGSNPYPGQRLFLHHPSYLWARIPTGSLSYRFQSISCGGKYIRCRARRRHAHLPVLVGKLRSIVHQCRPQPKCMTPQKLTVYLSLKVPEGSAHLRLHHFRLYVVERSYF